MSRPWCIALSLIALLVEPTRAGATTIGPLTNPANGHDYYVTHDLMTWDAGEAWATGLGGHLVTINDSAENAWILGNIPRENDWYWLGGRDTNVEGSFEWVTGEPWTFTDWLPGEPDDDPGLGGADHVALQNIGGGWFDTNGNVALASPIAEVLPKTGVDPETADRGPLALSVTRLASRDGVRVRFDLRREGRVHVGVFDVRGRPVRTLYDGVLTARAQEFHWDETDPVGRRVGSGLYFVSVRAEGFRRTGRVVLAR